MAGSEDRGAGADGRGGPLHYGPGRVAAKFTAYLELFRTKVRDNAPALADEEPTDHGVPVLLVEVDLDNESNPIVAKKLDDYRGFFEHYHVLPNPYPRGTIGYLEWGNRADQRETHWRRTYPPTGRPGYPPVALILGHLGERAMRRRVTALTEMTRRHWQGEHLGDGYHDRTNAIPILITSLEMLIERGPLSPIWRRAGRPGPLQPLHDALDDHDGPQAYAKHQKALDTQHNADQAHADRRHKERDLLATACPECHRTADKSPGSCCSLSYLVENPGPGRDCGGYMEMGIVHVRTGAGSADDGA